MNTCPTCGAQIDRDAKFCKECGSQVGASPGASGDATIVGDTLIVPRCPICEKPHRYPAVVPQSLNYRQMGGRGQGQSPYEMRGLDRMLQDRMMRPGQMGGQPGDPAGVRYLPCLTTGTRFKIPWPPQ